MHITKLLIFLLTCFLFSCQKNQSQRGEQDAYFRNIIDQPSVSYDSLNYIIEHTQNDTIKVDALNKTFFKKVYSDTTQALEILNKLLIISPKNHYAQAKYYNLKGILNDVKGNFDSALFFYQKAIEISKNNFLSTEASAYNNIGLIQWNRGKYLDALSSFKNAQHLFDSLKKDLYQANVLGNIGLVYKDIHQPEKAKQNFEKALAIQQKIKDDYGKSVSLTNIAQLLASDRNHQQAINLFDSALAIKRKLEDYNGMANTYYSLATSHSELGHLDEALLILDTAEKLCLEQGFVANNLANIYTSISEVNIKKKNLSDVALYQKKLKAILDKTQDERNLLNYYHVEIDYYLLKNDYKTAFYYKNLANKLYDKLEGIDVKNAIHLYETQYETAKKEAELAKAENAINEQKLVSRRQNNLLLILGSGLVITCLIIYIIQQKNKQKQSQLILENELLQQQTQVKIQQQRIEIAKDLHDSLGAHLTFINNIIDQLNTEHNAAPKSKLATLSYFTQSAIDELRSTLWAFNNKAIFANDLKLKIVNFINVVQASQDNIIFQPTFNIQENLSLSSKEAINLYRVTQEIINNAVKYAEASLIKLDFVVEKSLILLEIIDNGKGFILDESRENSYGLMNIKSRIENINGSVIMTSDSGVGTFYKIKIIRPND